MAESRLASRWRAHGWPLLRGTAQGIAMVLDTPLSLWGGLDPETGVIVDKRHPQHGRSIADRVLVTTAGRGSSSSSTVLAEALRAGTGPAAVVLRDADEIVLVGALVIELLDQRTMPVVRVEPDDYSRIADGSHVTIAHDGTLTFGPRSGQRSKRA